MKIGFIGAGRVGTTIAKYLKEHGKSVTGFYSRSKEHAMESASFTDTLCFTDTKTLVEESDVVFLTVSDGAIESVFRELLSTCDLTEKIICHTSGSMASTVFAGASQKVYGYSVHPNFAVSDKLTTYQNFHNAFITIEGSPEHLNDVKEIFTSSGLSVATISPDVKAKYHAASVYASNLICGVFGASIRLLTECGFSEEDAEKALHGLFLANAEGIAANGPVAQLTGPVERNDISTVRRHLNVLSEDDAKTYRRLQLEVVRLAQKKHLDRDYTELVNLLEGDRT